MDFLQFMEVIFFPERCPLCGVLVEPNEDFCSSCLEEVRRKHLLIKGGARGFRCVSSFVYDGRIRRLILRIKYHERTQFIHQLARTLAYDITKAYGKNAFDIITAVPMYPKEKRKREYNQSELMARSLSKVMGIPYYETLSKIKRTKKQHDLKYTERKTNLSGAFKLIDKELVRDRSILIIDDIITSGYTLGTCCKELSKGKPKMICCSTIANAQRKYPPSTVI